MPKDDKIDDLTASLEEDFEVTGQVEMPTDAGVHGDDEQLHVKIDPTLEEGRREGFDWNSASKDQLIGSSSFQILNPLDRLLHPLSGVLLVVGIIIGFLARGFFIPASISDKQEQSGVIKRPESSIAKEEDPAPSAESTREDTLESETTKSATNIVVPEISQKSSVKPSAAPANRVTAIKFDRRGAYSVAYIGLSTSSYKYRSRIITKPYRLVLDLTGIEGTSTNSTVVANKDYRPMRRIRMSKQTGNKFRLVFDLTSKSKPGYTVSRTKTGLAVSFRR